MKSLALLPVLLLSAFQSTDAVALGAATAFTFRKPPMGGLGIKSLADLRG